MSRRIPPQPANRQIPKALQADADWAILQQTARGSRLLVWISLLAIIALIVWAALGSIDEVVRGEGKVVPSRQVQIVQSLDGGIVEQILVRVGEEVEQGQVLLRLDPTRSASSLGESRAEWLGLQAKAARLEALANGVPFEAPAELLRDAPQLIEEERRVWQARVNELRATLEVARQQLAQRQEELRETRANRDQAAASCSLTSQELRVTEPLLASGAVSEVELLRLRRDVARYCGEQRAAAASMDRIGSAIKEAESKLSEAELNARTQASNELSDVRTRLGTLREGQVALADRVRLADVRSPVRGTIKTLFANTVGGVVQPGKDILEIVPADDTLLLEVKINPRDIGFLHPGQKAEVKFTAYDFAVYGSLQGEVEQIGADTIVDDKGNAYYLVNVRTDRAFMKDENLRIIPGMTAEVHILTGKRSLLQYLLKPVLRAKSNAFTER